MNDRERFLAVVRGEPVDYVPIFGFPGSPGVSMGCMGNTYRRLLATGMPDVGGSSDLEGNSINPEGWRRFWGTTGPLELDFYPAERARGVRSEMRVEDGFEIVESETGAVTRQVIDNAITYSMPEFVRFDVRDRISWEFYRDRMTPGARWSTERIERECRRFDGRTQPLAIYVPSTWGAMRNLMGPEMACTVLYDDPQLAREIIAWYSWQRKTYVEPLIERLRPEIVGGWEDIGYRNAMIISPRQFHEFCCPAYREIGALAHDCGVAMAAVDSDGCIMELVPLLAECGMNSIHPCEVHGGNDLFALRRRFPEFILMGWLEKETLNEGNGGAIHGEIMSKVPPLLAAGRYFPNGDHGIQPLATYENLRRFLTLLHEVTRNPEGEFPRLA